MAPWVHVAAAGVEMAGSVVAGLWLGYLAATWWPVLDPWSIVVGVAAGFAGGLRMLVVALRRAERAAEVEPPA